MTYSFSESAPPIGRRPILINGKDIRCYYPLFVMLAMAMFILCLFWFGSRYPQLFHKAEDMGHHELVSYIYNAELIKASVQAGFVERWWVSFVNWIWSMRIGMSFGLALGALLHTVFEFYPPKLGGNIYMNTLKGILMGAPAAVCVNCAVPVACGITRGKANVEAALGFMFSSPTLNFIVISMVFAGLPWYYGAIQYSLIALVLLLFVPLIVYLNNRKAATEAGSLEQPTVTCSIPLHKECQESLLDSAKHVGLEYIKNLWKLIRTAVPFMLIAAVLSSLAMEVLPLKSIFAEVSPLVLAGTALVTVLLPIPIALDVMTAQQLYAQHVPAPYVMLFLFTLGTYSFLPMSYLWTEVSKKLALLLYAMFVVLGLLAAYAITLFA
jgi:uncharacterized membrane protein YraQ (UPF0718 family)